MCLARNCCLLAFILFGIYPLSTTAVSNSNLKNNGVFNNAGDFIGFQQNTKQAGHFVVIGAFRSKDNASKLIRKVKSVGFEPKHFFNQQRKLFYVYIFIYENIEKAYKVSNRLREVNFINDAWVFSAASEKALNEKFIAQVQSDKKDILTDVPPESRGGKSVSGTNKTSRNSTKLPKEFLDDEVAPPKPKSDPQVSEVKETKKKPVANTGNKKSSAIKVDKKLIQNSEAIKKMSEAKAGDLVVFDKILFHKNASVMRKLSKDEIERLKNVLAVNPNLRIKIHGHTNGDFKGEVYLLADSDSRFFKLSGKNKVVKGDDILLSQKRAEVIKRFLVEQGVAATRVETKGWGHKRMLFPKEHFKASQNRRVEIEILGNQ